jgi:stress response protein YsnF
LREEDVRVERSQATGQEGDGASANAFRAREIFIPLNQEVPTVQKQLELVEVIRAGKRIDTEQQTVTGQVRSERVEVAETRGSDGASGSSAAVESGREQGSQNGNERR